MFEARSTASSKARDPRALRDPWAERLGARPERPVQKKGAVQPLAVEAAEVDRLRAGALANKDAKQLQISALSDAVRLFDLPFERTFRTAARVKLTSMNRLLDRIMNAPTPHLEPAVEHSKRSAAVETLVRLHVSGQAPLDRALLMACIEELGNYGDDHAKDALAALKRSVGDRPVKIQRACDEAIARIDRAQSFSVAEISLEGPQTPVGGIASYLTGLVPLLPEFGHPVDWIHPLPAGVDVSTDKGWEYVPGSEDAVRINGKTVTFCLYRCSEPAPGVAFADDTYFGNRHGLYGDDRTGEDFPDDKERAFAGAVLALATMRKLAAIRKLGGGELTAEQVKEAERSLHASDLPDVLHHNDSHFGAALPLAEAQTELRNSAHVNTLHNSGGVYDQWMPLDLLLEALQQAGGRLLHTPVHPGLQAGERYINQREMMQAATLLIPVSEGWTEELLADPSNAVLRRAKSEGRVRPTHNAIDLARWDPSTPHGSQPATYDANDFSGKTACKTAKQAASELPIDPSAPHFTAVGRISVQKGFHKLLAPLTSDPSTTPLDAVMGAFPNLSMTLGGPAAEQDIAHDLEKFAARWKGRVKVTLGRMDARSEFAAADIALMPSTHEPGGLTNIEAQALGTRVVFAEVGGLPYASSDVGIPCNPYDPESVKRALFDAAAWASLPAAEKADVQRANMKRAQQFDSRKWTRNIIALMREGLNLRRRDGQAAEAPAAHRAHRARAGAGRSVRAAS